VRGYHVKAELLHQARQPWRLTLGQIQHEPRQRGGVDDWMLERALEASSNEPGVERIVAVFHENGALRESQECPSGIPELGGADEHCAVDMVALARVRIDWRAAIHQRVEKRKRGVETESLGPQLEDQERRIACRLNIDGDELGVLQSRLGRQLGCIDGDLFPRYRLRRAAGLEKNRLRVHLAGASARRARRISSRVTALINKAATA
jgi:hypothetical protein